MSDYEARIKTKFGELTIHFTDKADLENKLSQVQDLEKVIAEKVREFAPQENVLGGLEDIYTLASDGSIKLLKFPKQKADIIRLVLFLSSKPLKTGDIKNITGIDRPSDYMKHEHFIGNPDGTYSLSSEGRSEVVNKVIQSLRPAPPTA
jgi:hypothetical protein